MGNIILADGIEGDGIVSEPQSKVNSALSLVEEFTSTQKRWLTFIEFGLALSHAYPSGDEGVFYSFK
jgi:hypothetical protein